MRHIFTILTLLILQFQTLSAAPFLRGYHFTTDGKKIDGLIMFNRATFSLFGSKPSNIKFKTSSDSKAIKLTAENISSFVIEKDSFATVQNIKINSISGEYKRDFAQVVQVGLMCLYVHKSSSSDGHYGYTHDNFVISKDNKTYLGIWNLKTQRNEIAAYFNDRPDLKEKLLNKDVDLTSFQGLVKAYNQGASR
jgi:hypothetical protein